jgi:hypothetical protein
MAPTSQRPIATSQPGRNPGLRPDQLPTDSAAAPSPWPWAKTSEADLVTPRAPHPPASSEDHDTPPSPGHTASPAPQVPTHVTPPAPPTPQRGTGRLPQSLITAGCIGIAVTGGLLAVLMVLLHTHHTPVPSSPAAPPQPPTPPSPAIPAAAAVTPNPAILPTPAPATPTSAAPAPNPSAGHTAPAPAPVAVPTPARSHQAQTSRHSPTEQPAPAQPPQTPIPQLNRPQWAGGDAQPAPDMPACTADCAQSTVNRTPTHWSPDSP